MLVFGERVKKSISEQTKIIPGKIKMPSHEELCYIFNVDNTLTEDKTDNEAWIYLACSYYKMLMNKIKVHDYTKATSGAYKVNLDDIDIYISTGNDGTYNHSSYDSDWKCINLYTKDFKSISSDYIFRSNFIHEITSNPGFIYHEFFAALSNDPKAFIDFYMEIVDTCIDYVQHNLKECNIYAIYNELVESFLES